MDSGGGFPGGEAIAAVQDEDQFYGEDDDFDDLYNDVNVGEGFRHSLHAPDEPRPEPSWGPPVPAPNPPLLPPPSVIPPAAGQPPPRNVQIPVIAGEPKIERPVERPPFGAFDPMGARQPAPPHPLPPQQQQQSGIRSDLGQRAPAGGSGAGFANEGFQRQGGNLGNEGRPAGGCNVNGAGGDGGPLAGATLFVGDLHWWTTDADLEAELSNYGQVKEIKFFDEKASGKSKGYCQVDFYDPTAAQACKEGMNGHLFNGRPCVVALASPFTVRRMGEAQVKNQQALVAQSSAAAPPRGRGSGGQQTGGNYGRGGGNGGGAGGNWGRGGMGNRGQMGNMRNRMGPTGGRGVMGNGGMVAPPIPQVHPAAMLGQAFDPSGYGAALGRMGGAYGGFPAGPATSPFPPVMHSFPPVVAPHVNPAFFGRGMLPGNAGMWPDPNMSGWGGEEQSSYGDDAASDQQYGEGSHGKDRGPDRHWSGASDRRPEREKDLNMGQERSERRHIDDREIARERDRDWERDSYRDSERDREREKERERERERDKYRDDRDRHGDHYRHRDHRESERNDDWDRSRSSRPRSKSREVDHSKRRRLSPH